jgi:hypothetical protein
MAELDMSAELWKIANAITAFAVAQGIAATFAFGKDLNELQSVPVPIKCVLALACLLFGTLYTYAVRRCRELACPIGAAGEVWRHVTHGRYLAIWLFTSLAVFGLFAKDLFRPLVAR